MIPTENWDDLWSDEAYGVATFDEYFRQRPRSFMLKFACGSHMMMKRRHIGPIVKRYNVPFIVTSNLSIDGIWENPKFGGHITRKAFHDRFLEIEVPEGAVLNLDGRFIVMSEHK